MAKIIPVDIKAMLLNVFFFLFNSFKPNPMKIKEIRRNMISSVATMKTFERVICSIDGYSFLYFDVILYKIQNIENI